MKKIYYSILIFLPNLIFANSDPIDFKTLAKNIYDGFLGSIINFLLVLAVVFFAWTVLKVIFTAGDNKAEAKKSLLWGIIALFVMFSFWGILRIVNNTFTNDPLGQNQKYNFKSEYQKFKP